MSVKIDYSKDSQEATLKDLQELLEAFADDEAHAQRLYDYAK